MWNGTIFVDLDWPLNASSLLSASAELLVIDSDGCYLFCEMCLPWHSVHYLLPRVQKCSNIRVLYELRDFWPMNSPDLNRLDYKIWGNESIRKSAGCEWFEVASNWCLSWSETERYWIKCRWPVAQTDCIRSTKGQFAYSLWRKLAKTLIAIINYC